MPLTTFQGVADEAAVIPSEMIETFIAHFEYKPTVGVALAWARPGKGTIPVDFPRFDAMVGGVPSAHAETTEFEEREIGMSAEQITPALFGFAIKRSDEAAASSPDGIEAGVIMEGILNLVDDMDNSVLGSISSIAASEGLVTDTYDMPRFRSDVAAYKLLNLRAGPLGHVAVISNGMANQLLDSLETSSATLIARGGDTLALGPEAGFIGNLRGFGIYETSGLPVSTTGRAGGMFPAGQMASPLGLVLNELPNVRRSRGDTMELRAATQFVLRAWYGVGVSNDRKGQQVLGAA